MAVVVEQTIPFPSSSLDIENPSRWNDLLPLIRPSLKAVLTPKGQTILIDDALANSKYLRIAAVGNSGNFSGKILDDRNVTAMISERGGAGILAAGDIQHAIHNAGIGQGQGIIIVRSGKRRNVEVHGSDFIEVETESELQQDHILHLLGNATDSCRTSIHQTTDMLKGFAKNASTVQSEFHTEKAGDDPSIAHEGGRKGFQNAKEAVERDLKQIMRSHEAHTKDVVYSIHYSDVNGLSRLENYILGGEIAQYFDSANIPYSLSHSTILNHKKGARGFAISIAPISGHYLNAQPKPKPHKQTTTPDDTALKQALSPESSKMTFNDEDVRKRIEAGCNAVIKEESTITEYDTIVGDGDCGYTLRDGAKQVLQFIEGKDLSKLPETVAGLVRNLEVSMGGTSGALYCIYLTALASGLATESTIGNALKYALDEMFKYTNARLGDRTMMDALIPFVDTLATSGDAKQALAKAKEGVEGTKTMEAKLGRSTYLDESATQGVPDPGAYGLLILLDGMSNA